MDVVALVKREQSRSGADLSYAALAGSLGPSQQPVGNVAAVAGSGTSTAQAATRVQRAGVVHASSAIVFLSHLAGGLRQELLQTLALAASGARNAILDHPVNLTLWARNLQACAVVARTCALVRLEQARVGMCVARGADADTAKGLLLHHHVDEGLVNLGLSREVFNGSFDISKLLLGVVGVAAKAPYIGARVGHDVLVDLPQSLEGKPLVLTWPAGALGAIARECLDVRPTLTLSAATARSRSGCGTTVRSGRRCALGGRRRRGRRA